MAQLILAVVGISPVNEMLEMGAREYCNCWKAAAQRSSTFTTKSWAKAPVVEELCYPF